MLDQPVQEQWYDNTATLTNTIDYKFDNLGELLAASDDSSSYTFSYNTLGEQIAPTTAGRPTCRRCC